MQIIIGGVFEMFHRRIVELRKAKKITQEILAKQIGVTRSALSQYELGVRQPDYDIVKRIADYFGVSTDYLLGREVKEGFRKQFSFEITNENMPEIKKEMIDKVISMTEEDAKFISDMYDRMKKD